MVSSWLGAMACKTALATGLADVAAVLAMDVSAEAIPGNAQAAAPAVAAIPEDDKNPRLEMRRAKMAPKYSGVELLCMVLPGYLREV